MNALGILITILLSLLMLLFSRRLAVIPLLLAACYLHLSQQIELLSFNFTSLRILVLVGWVRIILREEIKYIKLNAIDTLILFWTISGLVSFTLLYGNSEAFINRLGMAYNYIGIYFLFRALIHDLDDLNIILKIVPFIITPLAAFMVFEHLTGRNILSILGAPEISAFRGGKFRSQGSFAHPILAGTMAATMLPLLVSLWWQERSKYVAVLGTTAISIILMTSASSGPLVAAVSGILGIVAWRYRYSMKLIRRGIVITLLLLHFIVMKAPVWFLFDRVGNIIGGSGWYRSYLIDQAINHFDKWWLIGSRDTASWMPFALVNTLSGAKADITNQFIGEGLNGGILTLILFILVIVTSFKVIGYSLIKYENGLFKEKITIWSMGAALFAHVMSFFSVAYFDQIIVFWFLLIAAISSLSNKLIRSEINEHNRMGYGITA